MNDIRGNLFSASLSDNIFVMPLLLIILNLCIQEDFHLVVLVDFYRFLDFPHLFPQTLISVAFIEKIIDKVYSHLENCS